jgi:peptidoglycan/xylan/chitin deacetylase (PgdA/CDA1 family)/glycosyltransferase involved in cell wall biosynthesis
MNDREEMSESAISIEISVVIPAFNEEKYLPACLQSLNKQDFNLPYEVIVVDNGSSDRTAEVASEFGAIVLSEPHRGITWARQKGLEVARGEIIACVDADTCVAADWLSQIYSRLGNDEEVVGVTGRIFYTKGATWRGRLPSLFWGPMFLADVAFRFLFRKPGALWGGNFAVKKRALIEVGGFNKEIEFYGEDMELSLRIAKMGKIRYNFKQIAYTSPRRYEYQPPLRTLWPYLAAFLHMVALNQSGDIKKLLIRRSLYAGAFVLSMAVFITPAFYPTSQFYGKVYCAGLDRHTKEIALTFDDGPDEPYTSEVLKILDDYHIKATFFLIGENAEFYPASVREIVSHGDIVANHSYSHSYRLPLENRAAIQNDLKKTEAIIFSITGLRTRLFRPPHGLRTPWFLKDIDDMQYTIVTWNDMTDDYDLDKSPQSISGTLIKGARPGGIIVMHDGKNLKHGVNRSNTILALPIIIDKLKQEGYTFVTLPELLKVSPYKLTVSTR